MRSGCCCENCDFAERIVHDEKKIRETIARCEDDLENHAEELLKRGMAYMETVELQLINQNLLGEMEGMRMCHRYPEPKKFDKSHWCGEHKRAPWS